MTPPKRSCKQRSSSGSSTSATETTLMGAIANSGCSAKSRSNDGGPISTVGWKRLSRTTCASIDSMRSKNSKAIRELPTVS
ncbi:hypothetical protein D3C85_1871160 [compost metagenome]